MLNGYDLIEGLSRGGTEWALSWMEFGRKYPGLCFILGLEEVR